MRGSERSIETGALIILAAFAVWLRLPGDPPALLWLDEAWRVRQALGEGEFGVLLLSEKVFVLLGNLVAGIQAAAFRVWPILGLVLAMAAASHIGRNLFRTPVWLWTCLTYALAGKFVMHSREFKPYGIDLGLSLAAVAAVVSASNRPGQSLKWCTLVSSVLALSTAVFPFVHAGTSAYLLLQRRFSTPELSKAIFVPAVVFAATYFGFVARQEGLGSTTTFWKALYLKDAASFRSIVDMAWATGQSYDLFGSSTLWPSVFVFAPIASAFRRDGFWALLLVPFVVQAAFSAAGRYPLFDRPSFYFYGISSLALPYVVDTVLGLIKRRQLRRILGWATVSLAAVGLIVSGRAETHVSNGLRWPLRPDARPVLEVLARDFKAGETLLLNDGIAHTFSLYAPAYFPQGSPLSSYKADWDTALRNRSLTELCFHLMLRARDLKAGETVWFASGHTGYAARYYHELLRRVGNVDILVDERAACLVRVRLRSPMQKLQPLCDQLWANAFPQKS